MASSADKETAFKLREIALEDVAAPPSVPLAFVSEVVAGLSTMIADLQARGALARCMQALITAPPCPLPWACRRVEPWELPRTTVLIPLMRARMDGSARRGRP